MTSLSILSLTLLLLLLVAAVMGSNNAYAQDKEKLIISFKIANPQPSAYNSDSMVYQISSIVTNNLNKTIPAYMDKNIEFNLKRANAEISDSVFDFALPITVMSVMLVNQIL